MLSNRVSTSLLFFFCFLLFQLRADVGGAVMKGGWKAHSAAYF